MPKVGAGHRSLQSCQKKPTLQPLKYICVYIYIELCIKLLKIVFVFLFEIQTCAFINGFVPNISKAAIRAIWSYKKQKNENQSTI